MRRGRVVPDPRQHVHEVRMRIDALQQAASDQREHGGSGLGTALTAGKQPVLAADDGLSKQQLGQAVVHRDVAAVEEPTERILLAKPVGDGLSERRAGPHGLRLPTHPGVQRVPHRLQLGLSSFESFIRGTLRPLSLEQKHGPDRRHGDIGLVGVGVDGAVEVRAQVRPAPGSLEGLLVDDGVELAAGIGDE